ncbi:hypothetical protein CBF34_02720 [Vagococcus penaei]|uniref:Uncharacterized protein n=1 Tax=Vagococcus penaei TaxID=633807 RepID=A0A1Q2D3X7_9ENTE|nr:glycosyltransferase family 4 protein [Vagococcus penaei]AQP53096.1 hypothetical protein BW732_01870 [Vagococcus penaei]RSU06042.1 hypothetical protein CBF34_02720 [Vagococcus penaei]
MKKALVLATVPSMIEKFNMPNIKLLQELGYEVHVACNFNDYGNATFDLINNFKYSLDDLNVSYHQIDFARSPFSLSNFKAFKKLKILQDTEDYSLVHMHTPVGGVIGRLVFKNYPTKVIYTAHGFHFFKGAPVQNWLLYYPVEKYLTKYTDKLITINQEDYDIASSKFKTNVELVNGVGVDIEKFRPTLSDSEKKNIRTEMGLHSEDFILTCVGELNTNKNQTFLVDVVNYAKLHGDNFKLLLVGKGDLKKELEDKINILGLQDNVYLLGYRTDIKNILEITDVLVSASFREGLPVNVIEGMAMGKPLLLSNIRGNRDLVIPNENGFVYNLNDVDYFMDRLVNMKSDKLILENYSDSSRELAKQFNISNVELVMKDIYLITGI